MMESLQQDYTLTLLYTASGTLKMIINDVNVDIIAHRTPNLEDSLVTEDIRLYSEPDIIAMKLNLSGSFHELRRGAKLFFSH